MKFILLASMLLVCSCSPAERSPGETLSEYFDSVQDADSVRTLSLSTLHRASYLRPRMNEYMSVHKGLVFKIAILRERLDTDIKNRSIVRFVQTVNNKLTGETHSVDTLDCEMFHEGGEWKVSECKEIS